MLDTNRTDRSTSAGPGRWLAAAAALVLVVGAAVVAIQRVGDGDDAAGPALPSRLVELVGGEVTRDLSGGNGWALADEPLSELRTPGPRIEVPVGTTVTVTFTNRQGWSGNLEGGAASQSFRVIVPGEVATVLWEADTGQVAPGETGSTTFTPDTVGEYRYISTGANSSGMFGLFVVTDDDRDG